jgi:hypothetical protein
MDEIQKVNPRAESLKRAREAKAAKRIAAASQPMSVEPQVPLDEGIEQQAAARQAARTPVRGQAGEVLGRNGERLSRSHTNVGDSFDVPLHMIPKDWDYQWNSVSVHGNADIVREQSHQMYTNGWRPVPAERHAGILVPPNAKGDILRGGMRLEERPLVLSQQARAEDIRLAKKQISDRNESLKLAGVRKGMPDGFEMNQRYRGTGGDIRMSIDKGLDIPAPSHTLADPGE